MTLNVLACFTALLAATTRAEPASPIAGVVVDREGRPAPGILITATPAGMPMTHGSVTDAEGRFEIEIEAAGLHQVAITDPRFVARVHPRTSDIWIGTAAPDVVYRFDPIGKMFTAYRVATRGATMRHLAIDPRSGDIWIAYGASPAIHPTRVARLRVRADGG